MSDKLRLDKWLWAARFYKTRSLAADDIDKGRVQVNDIVAKPSRELKVGDRIDLRQGSLVRTVVVKTLSALRGGAPLAQTMYQETPESILRRERHAEERRTQPAPSLAIEPGRPPKPHRPQPADWNRWSAGVDD